MTVFKLTKLVLFPGGEYCMSDTFRAECPENEIIMMTEALYGMMERNRCIQDDADMGMNGMHIY